MLKNIKLWYYINIFDIKNLGIYNYIKQVKKKN